MPAESEDRSRDSGTDPGQPVNPFETPESQMQISAPRLLTAAALGTFVSLSAAATLLALFFGVLVATGRRSLDGVLDLLKVDSKDFPWLVVGVGTVLIALASVSLGGYSARRMLRADQRSRDFQERRGNLKRAIRDRKDAAPSSPAESS